MFKIITPMKEGKDKKDWAEKTKINVKKSCLKLLHQWRKEKARKLNWKDENKYKNNHV